MDDPATPARPHARRVSALLPTNRVASHQICHWPALALLWEICPHHLPSSNTKYRAKVRSTVAHSFSASRHLYSLCMLKWILWWHWKMTVMALLPDETLTSVRQLQFLINKKLTFIPMSAKGNMYKLPGWVLSHVLYPNTQIHSMGKVSLHVILPCRYLGRIATYGLDACSSKKRHPCIVTQRHVMRFMTSVDCPRPVTHTRTHTQQVLGSKVK